MIEELAFVSRVENGKIWIKSQKQNACSGCGHQAGCGSAMIAKAMPIRELELNCTVPLNIGEEVAVRISDQSFLLSSFLMYLLPLVVMFIGLAIVNTLFPSDQGEGWLATLALSLILTSYWLMYRFHNLMVGQIILAQLNVEISRSDQ